jgi:tetratricopeptide (TPR) repeat protein
MPERKDSRRPVIGVCVFLVAITFAVFGQTLRHEFVNYDDGMYVYENPVVTRGLTLKGIEWVFTHIVLSNWHPVTMMSHMLDCQLYGLNAGGHHLTNVLLHTGSVLLLFLVLRRLTGFLWRSAFVTAVFAIHPLHVESVAWVAERKDVLSGLFFLLTVWAYARYVEKQSRVEGRASSAGGGSLALDPRRWTLDYCLVLLFFALGLMSKPMVVTLPFVLLLLDYWPLNRLSGFTPKVLFRLVAEKIPLLALSGAACVATMVAQKEIIMPEPVALRIGNAVVSYVIYLRQMVWPTGLAVLYPYPRALPGWEIALTAGLLAAISAGVFLGRQRRPYLLMGWLWYLGMLVPAIGLVQSGLRAHADRYTYQPQIGLYFALTWWVADLSVGWRHRREVLGAGCLIILAALIFSACTQTMYWRNSESLWTHTLACTSDNDVAHNDLGYALFQKGRMDEAILHFQTALRIKPDYALACYNLGNALLQKGRRDEAMIRFQEALQIKPDYAEAHDNLGNLLLQNGRVDEAMVHYQKALQIKPDSAEAHNNLGNALFQKGRVDEAIAQCLAALQIKPDYADAHDNLGNLLLQKGNADEAIAQFKQALEIKPGFPEALNNLAWVLATSSQGLLRNGGQAVELAERANRLTGGDNPVILHTLAAAYAEAGRFGDALRSDQKAVALARAAGQPDLVEQINVELKLYAAGLPLHEKSK